MLPLETCWISSCPQLDTISQFTKSKNVLLATFQSRQEQNTQYAYFVSLLLFSTSVCHKRRWTLSHRDSSNLHLRSPRQQHILILALMWRVSSLSCQRGALDRRVTTLSMAWHPPLAPQGQTLGRDLRTICLSSVTFSPSQHCVFSPQRE